MKKILLTLVLLTNLSFSQVIEPNYLDTNVFDKEWLESLDDKVNFITFQKSSDNKIVQFRIYRGEDSIYKVHITNSVGYEVFVGNFNQIDQIDLSSLNVGFYSITAEDSNNNRITKKITLL